MKAIHTATTFRASSIGDCLMGKYLLENIHAQYPDARCALVVASRGAMIRDLCAAYPWLTVVETNRRDFRGLWRLWQGFGGSELVVTQYAGKEGGKFSLPSKIAARLLARRGGMYGFADASKINGLLYDRIVPFERSVAPAKLERAMLQSAGIAVSLPYPKQEFIPNEGIFARLNLKPQNYILAHFFAGNKGRSLSPEKMHEILLKFSAQFPQIPLLVTGAGADRAAAEEAAKGVDTARVVAGQLSLQETMQLIAKCSGVVSVDTGIAHITAQLGAPLLVLATCLGLHWWGNDQYGVGKPIRMYTDLNAHPGGHAFEPYPPCINNVALKEVVNSAKEMFTVINHA